MDDTTEPHVPGDATIDTQDDAPTKDAPSDARLPDVKSTVPIEDDATSSTGANSARGPNRMV